MRHDEVYKAIFSHRIAAAHLLCFASRMIGDNPEWLAAFDPETLEQVPTEHIDETLHRHLNDLVWRVRLRGGGEEAWAYLFVLIEFQSSVDYLMALRVRTYVDLLYRGLCREQRFGASDHLPPVLPVVVYNGASPWTAAASVEDLVAPEGRPGGLSAPVPVFAGSRYVVLDVGRAEVGESASGDVVSLVIGIEKMSSYEEGYATLEAAFSVLRSAEHRELRRVFHMWFSLLVGSGAGGAAIMEFEEMERLEEAGELRTAVQDRVRAWREAEREAGRAEGRAEGREEGRAEGVDLGTERERELLRRQSERKFGAGTAGRVVALLARIRDPERLAEVGEWIIDCGSGEELIARLERAA